MWKCIGAAVPGLSHDRSDPESCQDVVYCFSQKRCSCVVLCDGAGSAKHARRGAQIVSETIAKYLCRHFFSLYNACEGKCAERVISEAVKAVQDDCNRFDDERRMQDYSATLLAVAVKNDKAIVCHVGDGVVGCIDDDVPMVISSPWNGEYANETVFATSPSAAGMMRVIRFHLNSSTKAFFLMSDGAEASFYARKEKCLISQKGILQLIGFAKELSENEFRKVLYFNLFESISKNTSDDCSMCFMVQV